MKRAPLKRRSSSRRRDITDSERYAHMRGLCEYYAGGRCQLDGVHAPSCDGRGSEAHHVQPRSSGGGDEISNLLWVHADCHQGLHGKSCDEGRRLGFLRDRVWLKWYEPDSESTWADMRPTV